ncbi:MAG TPA: PEGA domain-containing protein [Vicinamibacterales bacterium]|nr:PEGA domain-containing protein [Vicinamibacterales bacterium]
MSRFTKTVLAVASTLALTAAPAFAQHRGGGHSGGGSRGGGRASGRSAGVYRGGGRVYSGGGRVYGGARVYSRGGYYNRGYFVGPTRFYRPYYSFRPRFSIGFGLWAGYPFAYNYGYYDPFAYGYPYAAYPYTPYPYGYNDPQAYPYPPPAASPPSGTYAVPPASQGSIAAQPGEQNMGGLSFDISPSDAQIFVDGRQAGTTGEFTSTSQPMGLPAGHHHVEIRANGYQTMSFDVDIVAGQVIPYQGTMER